MSIKNKNKAARLKSRLSKLEEKKNLRITRSLRKLAKRKKQDIERSIDKPGWLFPPVRHTFSLKGNKEKQLGELAIHIKPSTSASERKLSELFLARFQTLILGKSPPQKRVRPKHKRDAVLVKDKPIKIITKNPVNDITEVTVHRKMDDLVFEETEQIIDDEEYSKADKRARKKHIQGKYRFSHPSKK